MSAARRDEGNQRPRGYVFLETLPKNSYGKVLKTELRKHHGQAPRNSSFHFNFIRNRNPRWMDRLELRQQLNRF